MTIKVLVLKSGEDVIADVQEMMSSSDQVIGYFLNKPCVVKLQAKETSSDVSVRMHPWMPFAREKMIPVSADWVVTMVTPVENSRNVSKTSIKRWKKKPIKLLVLMNNLKIVTQIEEVLADIGDPNCKMIEPYVVGEQDTLSP